MPRIQFRRTNKSKSNTEVSTKTLQKGEPYYLYSDKALYIGNSDNETMSNKKHIAEMYVYQQTSNNNTEARLRIGENSSNEITFRSASPELLKVTGNNKQILVNAEGVKTSLDSINNTLGSITSSIRISAQADLYGNFSVNYVAPNSDALPSPGREFKITFSTTHSTPEVGYYICTPKDSNQYEVGDWLFTITDDNLVTISGNVSSERQVNFDIEYVTDIKTSLDIAYGRTYEVRSELNSGLSQVSSRIGSLESQTNSQLTEIRTNINNLSWNDLKNKPFGEFIEEDTPLYVVEGVYGTLGGGWGIMASDIPNLSLNTEYYLSLGDTKKLCTYKTFTIDSVDYPTFVEGNTPILAMNYLNEDYETSDNNTAYLKALWDPDIEHNVKISAAIKTTIDNQYISNEIARVDYVEEITEELSTAIGNLANKPDVKLKAEVSDNKLKITIPKGDS